MGNDGNQTDKILINGFRHNHLSHRDIKSKTAVNYYNKTITNECLHFLIAFHDTKISLRMVNEKDRALVIAAQLVLSSIVAYIPEKYLYSLISNATCILKTAQTCKINHANQFSTHINMWNICILIAAIGFYGIVWYKNRRINLFSDPRAGSNGATTNGSLTHSLTRSERPKQNSLRLPGKSNMVYKNNYNRLNSNETDSILISDTNPFAKDVLKELSNLQNINARNGIDTDLEQTMRANSGVTLRRDGVLTTLL